MALWRKFVQERRMEHKCMVQVVKVMLSIPPNTGWIERAYSKLQLICTARRNKLLVDNIRHEFFLNVLELPVRECTTGYNEEIELASKKKIFGEFGELA